MTQLLWSKFARQYFGWFLHDLEALRLRRTLASLGILHRAFSLLNHVEISKTVSNYYVVFVIRSAFTVGQKTTWFQESKQYMCIHLVQLVFSASLKLSDAKEIPWPPPVTQAKKGKSSAFVCVLYAFVLYIYVYLFVFCCICVLFVLLFLYVLYFVLL